MGARRHRHLGCHVSSSGGLEQALVNGQALGVNTIQLHPSPPQRWNTKPYPKDFESKFLELRSGSGIERVFFHGVYLINLANPDPQQLHLSKSSLLHYLDLSVRIGGDGVIFHVGSAKHVSDEAEAYTRAAEAINWIMERVEGKARLLLEVAAGSGSIIGDRVEELAEIYRQVDDKDRVGFALDSQHLWASGYDLAAELNGVIQNIDEAFTLSKVWAIHLNDSKTERGSHKDRHENLGEGLIGREALRRFVNHPQLTSIPFILETPGLKEIETAQREVDALHALAEG